MTDDITLCLTMGKRPKQLTQTLDSLFSFTQFKHVLAVNDFGDAPTNEAFFAACPHGRIIDAKLIGHHPAVDAMYAKVTTPYIFHCEDDWQFFAKPNLDNARKILENDDVSVVCMRALDDFLKAEDMQNIAQNNTVARLTHLHAQWYGFTFNPHLSKTALWQHYGPYAKFKKERHISRHMRKDDKYAAYADGVCRHIGFESVANATPKSFWQKILGR